MEKERGSGGGAPRNICPGNALQIARKVGKRLLCLVIIASLIEKELQTLYFQVQHIVYTLQPFMVVLNLRRPLQEYVRQITDCNYILLTIMNGECELLNLSQKYINACTHP